MSEKPEFIYFDLDDTLLDHKSAEAEGLRDVYRHFDFFESVGMDELVETYHRVNSKQWRLYGKEEVSREELQRNRFEQTLDRLGLDGSRYQEVGDYYMEAYRNHWQWMEGAEQAFHSIRRQYPVGILTNGFSETQKMKFEQFGFYDFAQQLVISEDVGYLKPHPRIFEHATERTGHAADDILYVGDSLNSDVKGGTSFGWNVAWYTTNGKVEENCEADFVFSNFKQLCKYLAL